MKALRIALPLLAFNLTTSLLAEQAKVVTPRLDLPVGWTLQSITLDGKKTLALTGKDSATTLSTNGKKIWGSGSCNSYEGKAKFRDDTFTLNSLSATEMAAINAASMVQEEIYFTLLGKMKRFHLAKGELVLTDGSGDNQLRFTPTVPPKSKPLTGTQWQFTGFEETNGQSVSLTAPVKKATITLTFGEDGRLSGSGGVNRYFAGCETDLKAAPLKIGGIISTRKAGPTALMKQEAKFFKQLGTMTRFDITGDQLTLKDSKGEHALLFTATEKGPS